MNQLPAKQARQVARRLANAIGSGLRRAGSTATSVLEADVFAAAGGMLEELNDETLDFLHDTFAAVTFVEREAGTENWVSVREYNDLLFGGGPGLTRWFRWIRFGLEASCGDFFGELRRMGESAGILNTSRSQPTSMRPGSFTGSPPVDGTQTRSTSSRAAGH
jgi:hypothetical protein